MDRRHRRDERRANRTERITARYGGTEHAAEVLGTMTRIDTQLHAENSHPPASAITRNYGPLGRVYGKVRREIIRNERWARENGATIGDGCRILSNIVTSEPWLVSVGDHTTISSGVQLITHDGSGWLARDDHGRRHSFGRVSIGSHVFVGAGSIILPNVRIGDHVIVGAGSVVTRSVPDGVVVAGNPARIVGDFEGARSRMLEGWASDDDLAGGTRREQIDAIVPATFRPEL